ncbi:MAG: hypothetical protein JRN07_03290, partial [Nitrososphaerota archaeon]|nr:hypothetical protein [Nitrososphaerota archaeon]
PTGFSLDGYAFAVSDSGPPPLLNSTESAAEIAVRASDWQIAQDTSFLGAGRWSTYELPSPIDSKALGGTARIRGVLIARASRMHGRTFHFDIAL